MKAALVVLAVVAVVAVCDARVRTTTMASCPGHCTLEYDPVCVQGPTGAYYSFSNRCFLDSCSCRTRIDFTEVDDSKGCPSDANTECPDKLANSLLEGYGVSLEVRGAQSDSSESSDSSDAASSWRGNKEAAEAYW